MFLTKVIEGLDVGPNATRVGVVNYASRVKNEVWLWLINICKIIRKICYSFCEVCDRADLSVTWL